MNDPGKVTLFPDGEIRTKPLTKEYEEGWDRIFGNLAKKERKMVVLPSEELVSNKNDPPLYYKEKSIYDLSDINKNILPKKIKEK